MAAETALKRKEDDMANPRRIPRDELEKLSTEELQRLCRDVAGVKARTTNRKYLLKHITHALAPKLLNQPAAPEIEIPRGASVDDLLRLYATIIGRPTRSQSRAYLRVKLKQAMRGHIVVGARTLGRYQGTGEARRFLISVDPYLPIIDAGWERLGLRCRTTLFRLALRDHLDTVGEAEAAAAIGQMLYPFDVPAAQDARVDIPIPVVSPLPGRQMNATRITLTMTPDALEQLDQACRRLGIRTRTVLVRVAVHGYFAAQGEDAVAAALVGWLPKRWRNLPEGGIVAAEVASVPPG